VLSGLADLNSGVEDNCFRSMNTENWLVSNKPELGGFFFLLQLLTDLTNFAHDFSSF
jgi:hypothetical protein